MNKIIPLIRHISGSLVISIVILSIAYFTFLNYFENFLPLPVFIEVKRIYVNCLAFGFLFFLPVIAISNHLKIIRVVLLILVTPLWCLFSYIAMSLPEQILYSTNFANYRYHLTVQSSLTEIDVIYTIYKCNTSNLECQTVYTDLYRGDIRGEKLITDEKAGEVHFVRNDRLIFAYGKQSREVLTFEELGEYLYYIAVYPPYGSSTSLTDQNTYMLYKCKASFAKCDKLPFHYTDTGGSFKLTFDKNTQEVSVYQWKYNTDDILIYSYGSEPKCYIERCSIANN